MSRTIIAAIAAVASIVAGLVIRANADAWSRNVTRGLSTYRFDEGRHEFLLDLGLVFVALGVLVLAFTINRWMLDDRPPGPNDPM